MCRAIVSFDPGVAPELCRSREIVSGLLVKYIIENNRYLVAKIICSQADGVCAIRRWSVILVDVIPLKRLSPALPAFNGHGADSVAPAEVDPAVESANDNFR